MNRVRHAIHVAFAAAVALLCTLFFVPMSAAQTASTIDPDNINPSIVWVDVLWDGIVTVDFGEEGTAQYEASTETYCTGFIIDESGGIATAGHCVEKDNSIAEGMMWDVLEKNGAKTLTPDDLNYTASIEDPTVRVGQPISIKDSIFGSTMVTAQLVDYQSFSAGDNALLRVANYDTSAAVLPIATETPEVMTEVTTIGYPGNTESISEVDQTNPTYKEARISTAIVSDKGVPRLAVDGEIVSGMSGGPALNGAGEVVGINSSGFKTSTQSYITDTKTLRSFLTKNGVDLKVASSSSLPGANPDANSAEIPGRGALESPLNRGALDASVEDSSDDDSGVPTWSWFVVGGLALVVVGGGVAWKVRQRRNPQSPKEQATE